MAEAGPQFEWYDAWILAAVIHASDGKAPVPLWRLIAIADALNKAIVSRAELELGIRRLASAGYIRVVPEGFEATPSLGAQAGAPKKSPLSIGAKSGRHEPRPANPAGCDAGLEGDGAGSSGRSVERITRVRQDPRGPARYRISLARSLFRSARAGT
jgi:hypothetical protein